MKKVVLFSILVLNLAFGNPYEQEIIQCDGSECEKVADKLSKLCDLKNDGNACESLGLLFISQAMALSEVGRATEGQNGFNVGMIALTRGCHKLKHKGCCNILNNIGKFKQ